MQEIKKRRIVIASVLKPLNDPRMFEKIGQSLSPKYEVHIVGTKSTHNADNSLIFFHALSSYSRLSLNRITSPLRILKKVFQIKPAVLIIETHELLWIALVAKIFLRCNVIYDIRENYYRNILYTHAFPPLLRIFIASYVRMKERITAPFIDQFFLAEAGYAKELSFVKERMIILENKLKKTNLPPSEKWSHGDGNIHLLFSGTLAPTTGVFVAIDLASKLHASNPKVRLHIVGFSPMHQVQREIKQQVANKPFIHFSESDEPVSHIHILDAIQRADVGVIAYPPNLSTENTIPTKLFEYMGYKLPILLTNYGPWVNFCAPYPAAIAFDPSAIDPVRLLNTLQTTSFYQQSPLNVYWESEEHKLLETVSKLAAK